MFQQKANKLQSVEPIAKVSEFHKVLLPNPRIYKEGLTERAIILCKLNKSLLEGSK